MKRDPRLHGLSSEHHDALRLARLVSRACEQGEADQALAAEVERAWQAELAPHFATEEEVLLPELDGAGQASLARRTREDHAALREHLLAAMAGDHARLGDFAELLRGHVRFEERELFPACERLLPAEVLDRVFERHPHPKPHC